jgi:hypothetical protein
MTGRRRRSAWRVGLRHAVRAVALATVGVATLSAGILGVLTTTAAPASATEYRYWTYWVGQGSGWGFAPYGAGQPLQNGALVGWRFEVSPVGGSTPPRIATSFAAVCSGRVAASGRELVALVVDYGLAADAPPGQHPPRGIDTHCADVPLNARGSDVLNNYAPGAIWTDQGLVCGIDGYPSQSSGCAVAVQPSSTATPSRASPHSTPSLPHGTSPGTSGSAAAAGGGVHSAAAGAPSSRTASPVPTNSAGPTPTPAVAAVSPPNPSGGSAGPSAVAIGADGLHSSDSSGSTPRTSRRRGTSADRSSLEVRVEAVMRDVGHNHTHTDLCAASNGTGSGLRTQRILSWF